MSAHPDRETIRRLVEAELRKHGPKPSTASALPSKDDWRLPGSHVTAKSALKPGKSAEKTAEDGPLRVAVGSDHGGFDLKKRLIELLIELGHHPVDVGTHTRDSCDYPDFARKVGEAVQGGKACLGIMIDGAGIGSAMALNKMRGIRAATVHSEATAINSRAHNDANVLVLGSMQIHTGHAVRITRIWLKTPHEGGRHAKRVAKINALD